ncbi:flagellar basal body P-ring formation protein FlgA [Oxalobacteraceae bacterium]|nr:flagellar basal body P-ring formation protein FlgA [Oxalobacteraceae bacterium]
MRFPLFLLALCVALAATARPAAAGEVILTLRNEVVLETPRMVLADVAAVQADSDALKRAVEALPLGRAPLTGQLDVRSRAELDMLLRGAALSLGQNMVWHGASAVKIRSASRELDEAELLAAAMKHVRAAFGSQYDMLDLALATPLPPLRVPLGPVEFQVRAADPGRLRARLPVWVDVLAQGTVYRSVVVPLTVRARQQVYVARRALAAGGTPGPDDVELRAEQVEQLDDAPLAAGMLGQGRLRQALAAGQIVSSKQVAPAGMVLRGDHVVLQAGGAGIAVETGAEALADALPGQALRVRPDHSNEAVMARVISSGVVRIDGR